MADTTPTLREAAQQALEALGGCLSLLECHEHDLRRAPMTPEPQCMIDARAVITALRAALAEQAAEQVEIPPAFAHAASQQMAVTSEWCRGWDDCRAHILSTAPAAEQAEPVERLVTRKGDKLGAITAGMEDSPGITLLRRMVDSICIINNGERDVACWDHGAMFDLRDLLCAAPPAPARQEWQPIETAPTDTEVLIGAWIDGEFKWGRSVRFYDSGNEREGEPACGWVWSIDDCSDSVAENPTHWMPLPAAPITAAPAEGGAA